MFKKDFDLFSQNYLKYCQTKSDNPSVLEVYKILLERSHWDSDYWDGGHGSIDINYVLDNDFTNKDWIAFEADLPNWTNFQLELITLVLLEGDADLIRTRVSENRLEADIPINTMPNRLHLLLHLLKIEQERGINYRELSYIIAENINLLNYNFDLMIKRDKTNLQEMYNIVNLLGIEEWKDQSAIDLKSKLEQAGPGQLPNTEPDSEL
jgi:hypothetical protein